MILVVVQCSTEHDAGEQLMGLGGVVACFATRWCERNRSLLRIGQSCSRGDKRGSGFYFFQDELQDALGALMFAELDGGTTVADHRTFDDGLWRVPLPGSK